MLFVAVLGYQAAGLAGAAVTLAGIMLPSTLLAVGATRWAQARQDRIGIRAFKAGLAPITIALLAATGLGPDRTEPDGAGDHPHRDHGPARVAYAHPRAVADRRGRHRGRNRAGLTFRLTAINAAMPARVEDEIGCTDEKPP